MSVKNFKPAPNVTELGRSDERYPSPMDSLVRSTVLVQDDDNPNIVFIGQWDDQEPGLALRRDTICLVLRSKEEIIAMRDALSRALENIVSLDTAVDRLK